jgi:23S rRNA pseudouridine1911/1915/1917 synthase
MVAPQAPAEAGDEDGADYRERPGAVLPLAGELADADEPSPAFEWREAIVDAQLHGLRLDRALVRLAPEFSRNHLQSLVERGHVRVDDAQVTLPARKLRAGQRLQLQLVPTDESRAFTAQPMALDIVFEDEQLLVIDKPAGLVVHPAPGNWSGTLLNGLLAHHAGAAGLPRAGIVHRLDKDTSGLMVVGKTLVAVTALIRAIAARDVQRHYLALAHGRVDWTGKTIDAPIGRDPASRIRMAVVASGKMARTDVHRVATADAVSALACKLHTGRTHQIRVHLAWIGHPLLADALYGGAAARGMQRQALHAARLCLQHPLDGRRLDFERAPPADFAQAWASGTRG